MFLDDEAIDEKARAMGLAGADGHVLQQHRATVAQAIANPKPDPAPTEQKGTLLNRSVVKVADGHLIVEISHVPNP